MMMLIVFLLPRRLLLPLLILSKDEIQFVGHLFQSGLTADRRNRLGDLSLGVLDVQFGIGIGGMPISTAPGAKHHVAAVDGTLVHLAQMHGAEMNA